LSYLPGGHFAARPLRGTAHRETQPFVPLQVGPADTTATRSLLICLPDEVGIVEIPLSEQYSREAVEAYLRFSN
jgi:hypothetical protein